MQCKEEKCELPEIIQLYNLSGLSIKRNSFWFSENKFSQFSRSDSLKGLSQPNCGKAETLFYILPKVSCGEGGKVLLGEMQFSETFTF